jgi:hypothetical protein
MILIHMRGACMNLLPNIFIPILDVLSFVLIYICVFPYYIIHRINIENPCKDKNGEENFVVQKSLLSRRHRPSRSSSDDGGGYGEGPEKDCPIPYLPPHPEKGTGLHRFCYFLFEQKNRLDPALFVDVPK